ncbi:hypothetical protein V6Z12_D13G030500 [Gossypium hirsutum]
MVTIKSPLPLILCCYLLVSFVFFPHGALSRQLQEEGGGNKRSKADVKRSTSRSAPSWVGQDSHPPPSSQVSRTSSSSSQSTARDGIAKPQLLVMVTRDRVRRPLINPPPAHKVYVSF